MWFVFCFLLCALFSFVGHSALTEEAPQPPALFAGIVDPSAMPSRISAPQGSPLLSRVSRYGDALVEGDLRLALLRDGKAQRFPEEGSDTPAMREAEREAIVQQRGLWAEDCCRVLSVEDVDRHTQEWRVVRGVVREVKSYRKVTYVNFGKDWRKDFTVAVPAKLARVLHPETWQGQEIEVRGWIHWSNGAAIDVVVPEQVDFSHVMLLEKAP